jgi:SAM-dependent methyltransferase
LNLAKKLWGKTDRRIPFNDFVFMLEEISSPTLAYEDMGRKAIAYSSLEACNFHKKLINDYAEWNTSTEPLYDFVIKKTVELSTANSIILDVGIGVGELELDLARVLKSTIIGLDKDPAFTVSKIWSSEFLENIPIAICGDIRKTPFRNNSIDIILSTGGLTSVYKVGEALIEIQRIIKHNGYFIFSDFVKVNQKETQEEIQGSLGFGWCLNQLKNLGFITEEIIENVCNGLSLAVMEKI